MIPQPVAKPNVKPTTPKVPKGVVRIPGGRVPPPAPKRNKQTTTRVTTPRVVSVAPPEDPIMGMFRSTLAQIKASASPVNEALIRAPYIEGANVAQGIGNAAAQLDAENAKRTSDAYATASQEAQQKAASFGIASGAGAGPALPDDTQSLLSQQSQAQQNAATGAGTAWAQLLNRVATAAVGKATLERQGGIDQASMSLAANLPSMYQARDTLNFQRQSQKASQSYLNATLTEKQRAAMARDRLTQRGQDVTARGQDITAATADQDRAAAAQRQAKHDALTQKGLDKRARAAAKNGLLGIPQVVEALKITPGKTTTEPAGWTVHAQTVNLSGTPYGPVQTLPNIKDARPSQQGFPGGVPKNFKIISAEPATRKVPGVSGGMTLAQWQKAVGILYLANKARGMTPAAAAAAVQQITPRPPK